MLNKVKAILVSPIKYKRMNGQIVYVPAGIQVTLDADKDVALIGEDHVDVDENEYEVLYLN